MGISIGVYLCLRLNAFLTCKTARLLLFPSIGNQLHFYTYMIRCSAIVTTKTKQIAFLRGSSFSNVDFLECIWRALFHLQNETIIGSKTILVGRWSRNVMIFNFYLCASFLILFFQIWCVQIREFVLSPVVPISLIRGCFIQPSINSMMVLCIQLNQSSIARKSQCSSSWQVLVDK